MWKISKKAKNWWPKPTAELPAKSAPAAEVTATAQTREWVDKARTLFDALDSSRDDLAMAERILDVAGVGSTDRSRAAMSAYVDGNPRGRDGRVVYDLRRDFATTPEEVRARFGTYLDAFPNVRIEVQ